MFEISPQALARGAASARRRRRGSSLPAVSSPQAEAESKRVRDGLRRHVPISNLGVPNLGVFDRIARPLPAPRPSRRRLGGIGLLDLPQPGQQREELAVQISHQDLGENMAALFWGAQRNQSLLFLFGHREVGSWLWALNTWNAAPQLESVLKPAWDWGWVGGGRGLRSLLTCL